MFLCQNTNCRKFSSKNNPSKTHNRAKFDLGENSRALLERNLLANNFHGFLQYIITKDHITSHRSYKLFKTAEDQLIIMCTWMNKIFQGTHWIATLLFPSQKFTSFACLY